ncbi:MAG TPA: response regulator transcription factor [Candidatus Caccosoma faecigallinarum]|uniref:Response regulator transcription factor n=1 Tax=Candidatus Caccosoma faecigallinarum TaxID=2840720 RepID=A0A9D1G784_9FIRM|nr:response regulator transcription factor [Candidatus Caccosoma faecigallinarum]
MKILLIEDEVQLSDALVDILKKEKYQVTPIYDGEDGLYYAISNSYDLIILDVILPHRNGFSILEEIRKAKVGTPVLMLTALTQESDKIKGFDLGADDYLPKPFSMAELLARIKALLRRKGEYISDNTISLGNLTLHLKSYELSTPYNSIKVSAKECELLRFLLSNPKFIATRDDLINKVWGFDTEIESNSIEVYMSFLRKKLVFLKSNVSIVTVRGVGYKLEIQNV